MIEMGNPILQKWTKAAKLLGLDGRFAPAILWRDGLCVACGCMIERDKRAYIIREPFVDKMTYRRSAYMHTCWQECEAASKQE